jgi:hypothetical protein
LLKKQDHILSYSAKEDAIGLTLKEGLICFKCKWWLIGFKAANKKATVAGCLYYKLEVSVKINKKLP